VYSSAMARRAAGYERELFTLGGEVARRRTALGLTQPELAERAGMSLDGVLRIERGKSAPTIVTLLRLTSALGCEVSAVVSVLDSEASGRRARAAKDTHAAPGDRLRALLEGQPPDVMAAAETCVRALLQVAAARAPRSGTP
jgi:transcriptional regulator with XRE-family HTH domain